MYVNRGMGAVARRPGGPRVIQVPYRGFGLIRGRRGMGASGSTADTCTSPNYWNGSLGTCCAPLGTPPGADPCSILNNPGFIAAQAADVGPIGPNGVPLSSPTYADYGSSDTNLASIASYPNNVQEDVQTCFTNPGSSFVDAVGMQVNCPAASTQMAPGINVSSFTYAQLAAALAPSITPTQYLAGNAPFGTTVLAPPTVQVRSSPQPQPSPAGSSSAAVSVRLVNSSGGSNSSFNVGDSWQIIVTGKPNAQVSASATQNGTSLGTSPMGTIGSNGQLVLTGTMASSQVGNWSESWTVGGQNAGSVSFSVAAPSGGSGGGGATGSGIPAGTSNSGASSSNPFGFLTDTFTIGSVAIPIWAAAGAGLVALFMFTGRR